MAERITKLPPHPSVDRILHMIILTCILLLIVTGLYIHRPWIDNGLGFMMEIMRGVHFFAAAILIVSVIFRVVRMFAGRKKDINEFIPNKEDWQILPGVINYYARIGKKPPQKKRYNPLQMSSYIVVFLLAIFQIITGFVLMYPDGALSFITYGIFNNELNVRVFHYIVTWLFIMFLIIHIYLGIRESFNEMKEMHLMEKSAEEEKPA
jgi:Ni/Fe-hydrogenase 1 B-type cytochrome subunit